MKRRGPYIAIAVAAVALVTVGLGAYRGEPRGTGQTREEICEDLAELSEGYCKHVECPTVTDEYTDACQASCVLEFCPEKVPCTGLDPIWCASCEDLQGARFWLDIGTASTRCQDSLRQKHQTLNIDQEEFLACFRTKTESLCPALKGTDWYTEWQEATGQSPPSGSSGATSEQ
ncbi:hypothetical protein [Polyangium sorediatum]|uniref:Uncharacterized protein n=1 Tax=Polyangium sorediatum TaxID=889274 RepID=A0ABT6NX39_9BACT|nr:hypothetical protein [Polyangium sorediatum]MDI1432915.1 hypothetical protein [Polyangium sorediatum]